MPDSQLSIRNAAQWSTAPLRDVCDLITRGRAPAYVESSSTFAIGQRCITDSGFDPSFARPHDQRRMSGMLEPSVGDVLLNSTGTGTIGRSCTFPGNGNFIVDGHVTLMRPKSHMADGRWIEYLLRSPWGQAHLEARCFSGSTNQVELSRTELAGTAIPLPPLFEQRRIADTLDAVDRAIHTAERLVAKLGKMRQGLLHDVLTCGVTESGELRDVVRHPEHFVDSAVGRVPRGWSVEPLGARIRLQRGFDITVAEQRAGDVPVVSSSGIASYHDTAMVAGPGVVIGRKGKLGDAYYVAPDFWPHDTTLWVTEFGGNLPSFVALLLKFMRLERFDAATSVPTLNRNVVHPLPVALPPADEQERIVAQVATFDDAAATEVIALDKLRLLRAGLLDDLLTGRVRARAIGDSAP